MPNLSARYEKILCQLDQKGRRRALSSPNGIDFTSNDYLGLSKSIRLKKVLSEALDRGVAVGAGGSRLLRGNHPEHDVLEQEAAAFFQVERALFFGSGYAANISILSALPQRGDLIVCDALVHASAHAGSDASRADVVFAQHNDAGAFDDAIRKWRKAGGTGRPWIAVESLYSMDGDVAPLMQLAELADGHDGFLLIDEAHATGVYGKDGRGLSADLEGRENIVVLHTCGKALGMTGAFVTGSNLLCDFLINHARPFIYATAPSPLLATGVREALKILVDEPERRERLQTLITFANQQVAGRLQIDGSGSQILPIVIGDNVRTSQIAARMQAEGFDIRPIRPPTVPAGTSRLRISITLNVDTPTIARIFDSLARVIAEETS